MGRGLRDRGASARRALLSAAARETVATAGNGTVWPKQCRGWTQKRLDITPGITGLWQVLGRSEMPFDEMVKLDYLYVTGWSLAWDIKLLLQTVPAVLNMRGAY